MPWEAPQALGGPVLTWEIVRGRRRKWVRWLLAGYYTWLCFQALLLFQAFYPAYRSALDRVRSPFPPLGTMRKSFPSQPVGFLDLHPRYRLEAYGDYFATLSRFLDNYADSLLWVQLGVIAALVPFLTAGSIGQEKERGTLFALFGTELNSRQIILGKLLGRLRLVTPIILNTLPALVFMSTLSGRGIAPVVLALAQEAVLAFTIGAACILLAVWIRSAGDAILGSYAILCVAYLLLRSLHAMAPGAWLDPFVGLGNILSKDKDGVWAVSWLELMAHLAVWASLGAACVVLASSRLRKVCIEQRETKAARRLWAFRPPVGDNPIRWRECYVIGLSPLPILRVVPRRFALLGVFLFSAAVAALFANNAAPGYVSTLLQFDFVYAFDMLWSQREKIREAMPLLGLIFILLGEILIGVRCATSVAEEKRRNTWDDLLLTAQSFREITKGKMWGVLQATVPYVFAYAMPVFVLAAVGGVRALLLATVWIIVPCLIVYGAALMGIDMLRVPPDMDETREGGAFAFERRRRSVARAKGWGP